ncbi:UNVERIFIED_CONTAM: hypothetical protein ABID98_001814 [Brevibacillus sp. OAP136]
MILKSKMIDCKIIHTTVRMENNENKGGVCKHAGNPYINQ